VEILGMAYAYNSPDYALNHTLFLSYEIRNKTAINYKDFYVGLFTDFDIGYSGDDYIGCDSLLNIAYGYNGKAIDGYGEPWAYGSNPPAQGTMFLNQKMNAFMYFNNNEGNMGDPNVASEYYNYLQGKWKNGAPLTYGGSGYNPGSTNYTKFAYSGDPVMQTGWTEVSESNDPDDRRGIMSTGPFTLNAGDCINIDIAFPYTRDDAGNNIKNVTFLKQNAQAIKQFYNTQSYEPMCAGDFQPELCEKPSAILGVAEANKAVITWNKPENIDGILTGYYVYRDGKKVETTANDVKEYIDKNLDEGTYVYQVSAAYFHCEESELTEEIRVRISPDAIHNIQTASFNIYPNPATGMVTIEGAELNCIEIYDVFGREVEVKFSSVIPNAVRNLEQNGLQADRVVLNISHFQSGIYYIKLYSKENQVDIKRLVMVR